MCTRGARDQPGGWGTGEGVGHGGVPAVPLCCPLRHDTAVDYTHAAPSLSSACVGAEVHLVSRPAPRTSLHPPPPPPRPGSRTTVTAAGHRCRFGWHRGRLARSVRSPSFDRGHRGRRAQCSLTSLLCQPLSPSFSLPSASPSPAAPFEWVGTLVHDSAPPPRHHTRVHTQTQTRGRTGFDFLPIRAAASPLRFPRPVPKREEGSASPASCACRSPDTH